MSLYYLELFADSSRFKPNAIGEPIEHESGIGFVYQNPELRSLRNDFKWPGLQLYDSSPIDPIQWEADKAKDPTIKPSDATHRQLIPRWHQITAVASIIERGYLDNTWTPQHFATLLCDEVGMGKTWVAVMLIGLRRFHRERLRNDSAYAPPCMRKYRTEYAEEPRPE